MKIKSFEDIIAWQKSQHLLSRIYLIFENSNHFWFRDQILRATLSVSNNIAEGFERNTDKDFRRFLYISLASCSEVKSMIYSANTLNFITKNDFDELLIECQTISKIINGLINSLNRK